MNDTQIGIKLADGSFYPVLDRGQAGRKRLVLTTVRDNQETVQIDFYRGQGEQQSDYVGSLVIEGIAAAPQREPEIELVVRVDDGGTLEAEATDLRSREKQTLSVSLESAQPGGPEGLEGLEGPEGLQGPEGPEGAQFELESDEALETEAAEAPQESLLTGETYPVGAGDRRKELLQKGSRKTRPLLLIALLVLSVILAAVIAFVVYCTLSGKPLPLRIGQARASAEAQAAPVAQPTPAVPAASTAPAAEPKPAASPAAAAPAAQPAAGQAGGVWYTIKWGDTLWDIAGTYYRNPWLYPKIAKANDITNPDLIFAGRRLLVPEN